MMVRDFGTFVHRAIANRQRDVVDMLVRHLQLDLDEGWGSWLHPPLVVSVQVGDLAMVKYLISHGAGPGQAIAGPLLLCAADAGHVEVVQNLVQTARSEKKPSEVNEGGAQLPLHAAAKGGHFAVAKFLLENGAEVDHPGSGPNARMTPLLYAMKHRHTELAQLLVDYGAKDLRCVFKEPKQ